jgi:hypothetical protein
MNDKLKLGDCKRGLSSLIRPHFTEGLLLQDDDLTAGVSYTRELSRLMFRTLFGCGVLCGLKVSSPVLECGKLKIGVAKGVALSCIGDPIELPTVQTIEIDVCKVTVGNELWIGLKQNEKCCAPRTAICSPDDDEPPSVCTRERDGYELCAFSSRPPCSCGCAKLEDPPASTGAGGQSPVVESSITAPAAPAATNAATAPAASPGSGTSSVEPPPEKRPDANKPCLCNQRTGKDACYDKFYQGECPCDCCDCEWIVLAKISSADEQKTWTVDHSVRRFVRPVLMRDPLVP